MKAMGLSTEDMTLIGNIVADNTGQDSFAYLCQRIHSHGHTADNPGDNRTVFRPDLMDTKLLDWVQQALTAPDSVYARDDTRILFLKDLGEYIGYEQSTVNTQNVVWRHKIAVLIDLQHVQDDTPVDEDLALVADRIALVVAYPTN